MSHLPLGIPPLPQPPRGAPQQSRTMGYATGMYWGGGASQSSSQSRSFPAALQHASTSTSTATSTSYGPHDDAGSQKRNWRAYMQSLGTQLESLDVNEGDKPLPPIPTEPPIPTASQNQIQQQSDPNSYYAAQHGFPPPAQVPVQWYPPPQHHPAAHGLHANGSPYVVPYPPAPQLQPFPPVPPPPARLPSSNSTTSPPPPVPPRPDGKLVQSKLVLSSSSGSSSKSSKSGGGSGAKASAAGKRTSLPATLPNSKPKTKTTSTSASKKKPGTTVIDLTADSSDEYVSDFDSDSYTPSSDEERVVLHARASSAQPRLQRIVPTTPIRTLKPAGTTPTKSTPNSKSKASLSVPSASPARSPSSSPTPSPTPGTVQCAGFTRAGAPCKRTVKAAAPFLAHADTSDDDAERIVGRYCKDHAGLVCAAKGFYWRDARGKAGVWIDFDDYIPSDLGQQTQTLLRMTMESPLTAKELPGFLYAYELRSLSTPFTSYFKVGRTDNVPRRIGQWSNQCTSHTPTLRDIFPLKAPPQASGLHRRPSAPGSLLPGAVKGGVDSRRMVPAVKRWERLVHLELADRASTLRGKEYDELAQPCADCGAIHKEIFPLADGAGLAAYENVVVDAIGRWEAFIRAICD